MKDATHTFADIIGFWPSRAALAGDIGVPMERVKKWAQRNSIPGEYWASLLISADGRGISLNATMLIQAADATRRDRAAA